MKWTIFFGLIIISLFVIACSPSEQDQEEISVEVGDSPNIYDQIVADEEDIKEISESDELDEVVPNEGEYSEEVAELIEKNKGASNYRYTINANSRNQYDNFNHDYFYEVYFKDDKIKKIYNEPVKLKLDIFYNIVYLDLEDEVAYGVCDGTTVLCDGLDKKAYDVGYNKENVVLDPLFLLDKITYAAKIVGSETLNGRKATILEYVNKQGTKERLSVDTYYGLPLKQVVYELDDDEEVVVKRNDFNIINVGGVKNADVNLPEEYEIVE